MLPLQTSLKTRKKKNLKYDFMVLKAALTSDGIVLIPFWLQRKKFQLDLNFCLEVVDLACYRHMSTAMYGKCSKISNTLKLRTPKIIAANNFQNILKNLTLTFFSKSEFLKLRTRVIFGGKSTSVYARFLINR